MGFSHIDENGTANMVDVSGKSVTERTAIASGTIRMSQECFLDVKESSIQKGDVLSSARLAGIMAAKRTSDLIPLCHNIPISKVSIDFIMLEEDLAIRVICFAKTNAVTGIEMEALTGATVALLTVYDMCKAVDKSMIITEIYLEKKTGGKSGEYNRSRDGI